MGEFWTVVRGNALTAGFYVFVGKAALALAFLHPTITAVWPSTGIAVAACLLTTYRVLPGIFVGAFLVNQTILGTVSTAAAIAAGNTAEAMLGAFLLTRFANGSQAFWQAEGILKFAVLVAMLSTTVSATVGVLALAHGGEAVGRSPGLMWLTWWLGDGTGALLVTPAVMLWCSPERVPGPRRGLGEQIMILGGILLVSEIVFGRWGSTYVRETSLELLFVPMLTWSAVRLGPRRTAVGVLFVSTIALIGTLRGFGPFVRDSVNTSLILLQFFLGIAAITALATAAAVAERSEALEAVQRSAGGALAAEERIRAQIAEFLHSHVQNRLLMAWFRLQTALKLWPGEPDAGRNLVKQVADDLDQIRENDVRHASYRLHPSFIRDGLIPAVRALIERFEDHLVIELHIDPALSSWDTPLRNRLSESLRLVAFRIIEEALGNVVRHARADEVRIGLDLDESASLLNILIADDGRGFVTSLARRGLGWTSIDSRVLQAGGWWQVASLPDKGTTVTAHLPLRNRTQADFSELATLPESPADTVGPREHAG